VLKTRPTMVGLVGSVLITACSQAPPELTGDDWPAESEDEAANLTHLCKGFRKDLSGAVWNPVSRTLWVCRNGPGPDSKLWVLEQDDEGQLQLGVQGEALGEWTGLGDSEGVTFADFEEEVVYIMVEGKEQILELDVSTYGELVVNRIYDTSPFLPLDGRDGAEGITFVPDEYLERSGFVDGAGNARISRNGMGGLMFVGHQNGGGIHAFDLERETGAVEHLGEFRVAAETDPSIDTRVVGLEFDRSTNRLLVWHGPRNGNLLSVLELASREVEGAAYRSFHIGRTYPGPSGRSYEGVAVMPRENGSKEGRALFLTVDNGKKHSLFRYDQFVP